MNIALFLISILLVFISCDLSTNGIEWIGRKFKLSESVVGYTSCNRYGPP
ncbi:MAG: hypothetical protein WB581_01285 [Halobacteriota archaeon]